MARTNIKEEKKVGSTQSDQLRYKKLGGGSMRLPGRIIKPGQTFMARPDDIPAPFRKLCQLLSDDATVAAVNRDKIEKQAQLKKDEDLFTIVEVVVNGKTKWNVINSVDNKAINDEPLNTEKAAKDLKAELEG